MNQVRFFNQSWKKFPNVVWQYWKYLEASPDHGGHFLSLEFLIWTFEVSKKFSYYTNLKDIEIMMFDQNILIQFWASFFQNLNFFQFSWYIIWLVCSVVMVFYWRKEPRPVNFSDTSNMFVKSTKRFLLKKWGLARIF